MTRPAPKRAAGIIPAAPQDPAAATAGQSCPPPPVFATPGEAPSSSPPPDPVAARTAGPGPGECSQRGGTAPGPGRPQAPPGAGQRAGAPVPGGSRAGGLTATAHCIRECDWTEGPGTADEIDKAAAKHTEKPPKHATATVAEPARRAS